MCTIVEVPRSAGVVDSPGTVPVHGRDDQGWARGGHELRRGRITRRENRAGGDRRAMLLRVHNQRQHVRGPHGCWRRGRGNALVVTESAGGRGNVYVVAGGADGAGSSPRRRQLPLSRTAWKQRSHQSGRSRAS
jgi:hypothetical protein